MKTNPVQEDRNRSVRIHDRGLTSQGDHFAQYAYGLVDERVEVFGANAGGCFRGHLWRKEWEKDNECESVK